MGDDEDSKREQGQVDDNGTLNLAQLIARIGDPTAFESLRELLTAFPRVGP